MHRQNNEIISYEELLGFYAESGVDCALNENAINRFLEAETLQQRLKPAFNTTQKAPTKNLANQNPHNFKAIDDTQINLATKLANNANSLEELKQALQNFNGCTLKMTASNTCFSDGLANSALMLVGETPGREDDRDGIPFMGKTGELLNRILKAIGLDRNNVYITNTIFWRPPGNRPPTNLEIKQCLPFLNRQIELNNPQILVALGTISMQALTGNKDNILRARGKWLNHKCVNGNEIPVLPTFDLANVLQNPVLKKSTWKDFLEISKKIKELSK